MFLSYEVMATFGISMVLSFTLSVIVLLVVAAKRGLLRVGATHKNSKLGGVLLLPANSPEAAKVPKSVELTPLATYTV
ncbi:hypothetical protein O3G_MSEX005479 [Manduca sexta]|uniref:Uncharacterized protein n=1 Tax=Manduca sexta TaxID=7130 RepID=A0A921YZY2_MANSE|nr:hypothetical protein O3G_MSEX005479 [Manduca sexta]